MKFKETLIILGVILFTGPSFAQKSKKSGQDSETPIEEKFIIDNFRLKSPGKWQPGERFIYMSPKINITLKPSSPLANDTIDYTHKIFNFKSFKQETDWLGKSTLDLEFDCDGNSFVFKTGKTLEQFQDTTYNPLIPGLIWLPEIEKADSMLKGKVLYILVPDWLPEDGSNVLDGNKYVPVTITAVTPGDEHFPVRIHFDNEKGEPFSVLTHLSGTLNSISRLPFYKLFSFSDPRKKHKDINDENWKLITEGKITIGMTQAEVRLSLGKPADINRIPTYSGLKEQWFYKSGAMVFFEDSRVTTFRK